MVIFEVFIFHEQPIQSAKSNFTNGDTDRAPPLHINNYFSRFKYFRDFKFSRIGCALAKFAKYERLKNNPLYGALYSNNDILL